MIKPFAFKAEFIEQQDVVDKINECVRALNNLESLITSHNKQSTPCSCKSGRNMYISSGWRYCPYCGCKL